MKKSKLESKVAIITGAGRGIGRAIALAFAREGANVVLSSRTVAELEKVVSEVRSLGRQALAVQTNVARLQDAEAMVAATLDKFGRIDILVNNAGVQGPIGPLWENNQEEWINAVLINLGGAFFCCRAVIPVMIEQCGGKIINLSGGGSASPRPYFTAYAVSKTAVVRLTETLAEEVSKYNVQVNAIAPGAVYTKMTEEVLASGDAAGGKDFKEAQKIREQNISPQAAADLAVFLASEQSNGLTGRLISAQWDDWRSMPERMHQILTSNLYTLRRVTEESIK